ncbi:unnamed protein product [Ilex paraguariensis]|uniref:3,9-dihydroxypterocarpan 6A-monooxygenase n=1 Tax=Ilex paraguariensis TaxID=185542 RepID=A0ABC8SQD0_9AQUA
MAIALYTDQSYLLFFICLISGLLLQSFIKKRVKGHKTIQLPPSPLALPIIGHLHLLGSTLHQSFQTLAFRYGPLMLIRAGTTTSYVVSNAIVAKEVFKTHDIDFASRPEFGSSDYNIYKDTLFSTLGYGKYWIFMKKVCMMELLSAASINRFADIRRQEMVKLLELLLKRSGEGESCDVGVELMSMTNNMICRMTMSTRCSGNANESTEIREIAKGITLLSGQLSLGEVFGPLKKYDLFGAGKKVKALLIRYDQLLDRIIMEHEKKRHSQDIKKKDMMDILLEISDGDQTADVKLTRNGIKGFFLHHDPEDVKGQRFDYVPFGGGRRGCPGSGLAAAVMHVTLAAVVQCFHWKLKSGDKVDMEEGAGFSAALAHPLVCYPTVRVNTSVITT